jgi:hypothetical protein
MTNEQQYKDHIAALEKEIDDLEEVVRGLEAEGLQPLVDRMRLKLKAMKTLVSAMATAIDELLETPGNAKS